MKFLICFKVYQPYETFCIPEFKALISPYNLELTDVFKYEITDPKIFEHSYLITKDKFKNYPFVYVELPNEEIVKSICQRTILIEKIIKVIGEGANYE